MQQPSSTEDEEAEAEQFFILRPPSSENEFNPRVRIFLSV